MEACQGLANDLASDNWPLTVGNGGGDHHHHHLEHGAGGDGACHEEEGHLGQGGATCSVCKEVSLYRFKNSSFARKFVFFPSRSLLLHFIIRLRNAVVCKIASVS